MEIRETIIKTQNKCKKCGENYILTIAGWKCPNCDLKKLKKALQKGEGK